MISAVAPFSQKAWIEMRGMGRARSLGRARCAVIELGQRERPTPTSSSELTMGLA